MVHVTCAGTTIQGSRSAFATIWRGKFLDSSRQGCGSPLVPLKSAAMKATIYHNPQCGTSRKTLEILRDSGADVWIHEYLKNPPSRGQLEGLYQRAGMSPRDGLRAKEPLAQELGLNDPGVTDGEILDAMVAHPILIERPLVETGKGVRLCRPQDLVREIL
jgi:arsenate reductase